MTLRKFLFWLCLVFLAEEGCSQNYYEEYLTIKKARNFKIAKLTDSIIQQAKEKEQYEIAAKITYDYSIYLYRKKRYSKALKYAKDQITYLKKLNRVDKTYLIAISNVGFFLNVNYQWKEAIEVYEQVIELNLDKKFTAKTYGRIGECLYKLGDFYGAIGYYKKSIFLLQKTNDYRNLLIQYLGISNVYVNLEDKKSLLFAIDNLKKANTLKKYMKFSPNIQANLNITYANIFTKPALLDLKKAEQYYLENIKLGERAELKDIIGSNSLNISHVYNELKDDKALFYIEKGIKNSEGNVINLATSYENYSQYYLLREQYDLALNKINKAIQYNLKARDVNNPSELELFEATNRRHLLFCLKKKAEILLKISNTKNQKKSLKDVVKTIRIADKLVDILQSDISDTNTKLFWRSKMSQAYSYGTYAAHLLSDPVTAFSFMEKNKALLLTEAILKNTEFANLPREVISKQETFKKQIYKIEDALQKKNSNQALQDSLFDVKRDYKVHLDSLKNVYPNYFGRAIEITQITMQEVQKDLEANSAVISYLWNEFDENNYLIGLLITKDSSKTFEVSNVRELKDKISKYRRLISRPFSTKKEKSSYQELAYELYQELFPSQEIRDLITSKNLMVIPDGNLQNIPFESFITKEDSNDFLILNQDINYLYSYSFLQQNQKVKRTTNQEFIGYSPVDFDTQHLSKLYNAKIELETINEELNGTVKLGVEATKKDFLSNSTQSKIVHLATHADSGDHPWIAFTDGKIELHELYTYKNNADLVTLSACNTSLGESVAGEGILSLARGFFYSGSKSVISSLWEVNDKATRNIMINFYKNIKKGQTKSEAINNAKRVYIVNHKLSELSPYYWSSFILIGDAGTIEFSSSYTTYITFLSIGILLLLFIVRKK